jgi:hypothetical protein
MTTFAIPTAITSKAIGFDMQMTSNVQINQSPTNRAMQTVAFPGDLWVIRAEWPQLYTAEFRAHSAFWNGVRGAANRVRFWPMVNRGVPFGTMRGSPTLNAAASEGANAVVVSGTGTLLAGDYIGVTLTDGTTQLCEIREASGTNTVTCQLVAPLRSAASAGGAVIWNKPTVDCILTSAPFPSHRMVLSEGYTIEAVEAV